jgi:hypothetical protein
VAGSRTGGRRLRYLVGLGVAAGLALLVAAWSGAFEDQYEFRKESRAVLKNLTGGDDAAKTAYDEAAFLFQEASLLTSFVDRVDRLTRVLGTFETIESVIEVETLSSIRGKTARVRYLVRFRNESSSKTVTTPVELSYLMSAAQDGKDGKWRLLGFNVSVPKSLESNVKMIDSEYDRIKAPEEVVELVDQTLAAIEEGKGADVRSNASQPFQDSTTAQRFSATLERYRKELGHYQRRLKIHSSGQNARKDRARVHVLLQFEKGKTSGNFEFIKRGGAWRLLHLKILIPEPLFPRARSE